MRGAIERALEREVDLRAARERGLLQEGRQGPQLHLPVALGIHGAGPEVDLAVGPEGARLARDREAAGGDASRVERHGERLHLQLQLLDAHGGAGDDHLARHPLDGVEVAVEAGLAGQGGRDRGRLVGPEGLLQRPGLHAAPDQAQLCVARGQVQPRGGGVAHERGQGHAAGQGHRAARHGGGDAGGGGDVAVQVHAPVRRRHERRAGRGHRGAAQRHETEAVRMGEAPGEGELALGPASQGPSRARGNARQVHVELRLDVERRLGADPEARPQPGSVTTAASGTWPESSIVPPASWMRTPSVVATPPARSTCPSAIVTSGIPGRWTVTPWRVKTPPVRGSSTVPVTVRSPWTRPASSQAGPRRKAGQVHVHRRLDVQGRADVEPQPLACLRAEEHGQRQPAGQVHRPARKLQAQALRDRGASEESLPRRAWERGISGNEVAVITRPSSD